MSSKQKADIGGAEFEFLHDHLVRLSKTGCMADYKSMLLMVKSFAPNSLKLKQLEYELAKDSGDTNTAAHIFSQLFMPNRDSLSEEMYNLFEGLKKAPPDKISIDIFSRLSHSTQRELFNAYFAKSPCANSDKADVLLYLLNLKEIRSQVQLLPTVISLAYRALRDGEAALANKPSGEFLQPASAKLSSTGNKRHDSPHSSRSTRASPKTLDGDEGEEGEVLGEDDDEDEDDDEEEEEEEEGELIMETKRATGNGNLKQKTKEGKCLIILNEYRRKMAYELLPATHQVFETAKLDKRLLEKIVNLSLNFLFEHLTSLASKPLVVGANKMCSQYPKLPDEYLGDCLRMGGDMLQWPLNLFLKRESNEESQLSEKTILKSTGELFILLEDSWEEITQNHRQTVYPGDGDTPSKKRRSTPRREDSMHANPRISSLALQCVALFWVMLLDTARKYVSSVRPSLMLSESTVSSDEQDSVSVYPLDFTLLFPSDLRPTEPFVPDPSVANTLLTLARLWKFRTHSAHAPKTYTLGTPELDMWDSALRPSLFLGSYPSLEDVVCFDLTLAGFLKVPWVWNDTSSGVDRLSDTKLLDRLIPFVCPERDCDFIRWILNASSINPFTQRPWTDVAKNREAFVKQLEHVANQAVPINNHVLTRLSESCWFFPYTQANVSYLGCKVIVHWLCSILVTENQKNRDTRYLNTISLACVLCQIDTVSKRTAALATILPLPCETVLKSIAENWSLVRSRFLNWIKPPIAAIADMSLINELVAMEATWLSTNDVTGSNQSSSEFMDACVSFMKGDLSEPIESRLRRFVSTEADLIVSCLGNRCPH